jgi:hypothetical protein
MAEPIISIHIQSIYFTDVGRRDFNLRTRDLNIHCYAMHMGEEFTLAIDICVHWAHSCLLHGINVLLYERDMVGHIFNRDIDVNVGL